MSESTIFGMSVRALLALFTVGAGFLFIFAVTFLIGGDDIVNAALTSVVGFVSLALGFYLGQKSTYVPVSDEEEQP